MNTETKDIISYAGAAAVAGLIARTVFAATPVGIIAAAAGGVAAAAFAIKQKTSGGTSGTPTT